MDDYSECSSDDVLEHILQNHNSKPRPMQFEYLKRITGDFCDMIGQGGYGEVYKGKLQNGKMIAVKKIKQLENPDVPEMQFKNEVFALMSIRHPNIVRCVGYCFNTSRIIVPHNEIWITAESSNMFICFEYLTMGSLDKHLKDESSGLDWRTCYKIIEGVCCGLHYLHEECRPFIIHLDLKPANILLDENMVPKVADFGLSQLLYDKKTKTWPVEGTFGYMAPEYVDEGKISTKADIYSLGVVIIEIITGCKADPDIEQTINKWRNRSAQALSSVDCQQMRSCLEIGTDCIRSKRNERPTIREILKMLSLESIDCSLDSEEGPLCKKAKRSCHTPPENQEEEVIIKNKEHGKKLHEKSREVRDEIELAKENGMVATNKIETWLSRADTVLSDGMALCESKQTGLNWDTRIVAARHSQLRECLSDQPSDIAQPPSVLHIDVHAALLPSQVLFVEQARQHIIEDIEGMIAICGPVGVGKTLLLKAINNSFETGNSLIPSSSNRGDPPFDFVIYMTALEDCSVQSIQSEIIQRLKMQDHGDSLTTQATRISKFLQDKSFLILLDGLHCILSLTAAVGLPLGNRCQLKRKVVITTRSRSLCDEMRVNRVMNVPGLKIGEALELFQQCIGNNSLYSEPRIGALAKDLVMQLRALPSELIRIGSAMRGKGEPAQWKNMVGVAKELMRRLQECLGGQPSVVTVEALPPSVQEIPCSSRELQHSRVEIFEEAMEYIKDSSVGVIGIWGLGGVGKTHLLTKINNSFLGDSLFDHVIFVTASKEGSVEKIQEEIGKKLKLNWEGDDVKSRANVILDFLKTKKILILLDDVWNRIDLEEVGIPHPLGSGAQQRRKVILTTRSKTVCGQMEVRKEIIVSCLPHDEAWQLFQDKVGHETLSSSPRIEALAKELAKELKGLPLALITIGRAMYDKSNPKQWESAVHYMKQSCCGGDDQDLRMENIVFRQLMFSYDSLRNDTLRECLLTCSLWPEDQLIPTGDLIRSWIGLGLVDDCDDIHGSYRKAHSLIGELTAACLLDIGEFDVMEWETDYFADRILYNHQEIPVKDGVKMHDVIRDMAIWISSSCSDNKYKWVVRAGAGRNLSIRANAWSRAECISLMFNSIEEFHPFTGSTNLKRLYLQENLLDERIFGAIQSFTELTYLDLSNNEIKEITEELFSLVKLEHLDLSCNGELSTVPIRLRELTKLKFLYLAGTNIKRIPKEVISCLTELQVIELITPTYGRIPKEVISCLTELQVTPTYGDNENYIYKIIQELCTLTNLIAVDIVIEGDDGYESLRKAAGIPIRDLIISGLEETELCLAVDTLAGDIAGSTLNELNIMECSMEQLILGDELGKTFDVLSVLVLKKLNNLTNIIIREGASSLQGLFPRLTCLCVFACDELQDLSCVSYLPCLEYIKVSYCYAMEQICMGTGQESSNTFPCLKYLELSDNDELASLCGSDVTFPCLESLIILDCPKLKRLPFTMQSLPHKLTELFIDKDCWDGLEWEDEGAKSFLERI